MARSAIGIRRGSPRGVDRHDLWCAEGARVDTQVVNLTVERGIGRELRAAEPVAGRCAEVGRPERQAGVGRDGRAIDVERSAARAEYDRDVRPGADGQDCGSVEALFARAAVAARRDREPRDVTGPVVGREKHVDVRAAAEVEDALPAVVCADVYPDRDGHARQRLEQRARKRDVVTRGAREIEVVADDAGRERRRASERSIVAVSGGVWDRRTGRLIEGVVGEERREALAPGAARPWSSRRASGATRARAAGAPRTRATNATGVGLTAAAAGVRASGATHARAAGADRAARPATTCSGLTARAAGARAAEATGVCLPRGPAGARLTTGAPGRARCVAGGAAARRGSTGADHAAGRCAPRGPAGADQAACARIDRARLAARIGKNAVRRSLHSTVCARWPRQKE